jgi:hypothetical protein
VCGELLISPESAIRHTQVAICTSTVIEDRQKAVGVWRQIDTHDIGFLVHDVVNKTGILVREAIVILLPDM